MSADLDLSQFDGMDREAIIAEVKRLREENAVLRSQVENADINLEQARMSQKAIWRSKVESAEARITELEAEVERLKGERDSARKHEMLNCMEAVWFEEALGFKDMPLGENAHELAKEKLRDMIAKLAQQDDRIAELERDRERVDWLLANIPGSAFRAMGIVYSDGAKREHIDAAMQTNPNP